MGKKRIIKPDQEKLLKEREEVEEGVKKDSKAKVLRLREGRVYISSTYNNTIITLTDMKGSSLAWKSAGSIGFSGTKKATPFAASKVAEALCTSADKTGINKIDIFVKGIGSGRDSAIRSLSSHGLEINSITDITPVPHNGCRPPKPRRV